MKVLIVDDSADIRALIRVILENKGHTVAGEAEDGEGALEAFKRLRPDVVLLDIIMPGKSGVEVLEEIRKIAPGAKVIIVTAVEQDRINRQLILLGAAGIIYKPFTPEDFETSFLSIQTGTPAGGVKNEALTRLAAGALSKCMLKVSDASSWAWELRGVRVFSGKIPEAVRLGGFGQSAAGIQINVRDGSPFAVAMLFRSEDISFISGCFVNGPLYRTSGVKDLEEGMLLEIGNIILNALAGPLINALNKSTIPSVPMFIKGGPAAVAAGLGACLDAKLDFRIISAALAMRRDGRVARAEVVGVLPEPLAAELERRGAENAAS
jgi:two-component system chemotaxis response regulator CheY